MMKRTCKLELTEGRATTAEKETRKQNPFFPGLFDAVNAQNRLRSEQLERGLITHQEPHQFNEAAAVWDNNRQSSVAKSRVSCSGSMFMIVDESHYLKNASAKGTTASLPVIKITSFLLDYPSASGVMPLYSETIHPLIPNMAFLGYVENVANLHFSANMFVEVAALRVKDLFASARSFPPSIIFINEIDAIGSKRGGLDIGGMLVIGATNRLDILDPALLRKGHFDKIIRVGLPSKDGRFAILKMISSSDNLCIMNLASRRINSFAQRHLDYIGREELFEALKRQKGTFGTWQEDNAKIPKELKLKLAYREAAVAVLW
ncbi:probable inactive ATP-dependent zinc metalloprotease FTSHI 4, chloroplastic [Arachis stenosperma]|uniref:probable inactive ATP-dependent zinc metalloprotease FTSHI 4, chloroplastic n=1 Tax=Arachis stenosperma TaxID=217475 RepID=UPI0025AD8564|nr:probable inactive ATP-dependent zinc metalloprotease FTSHI 4, chloroplastic [Arachis stenosperma]